MLLSDQQKYIISVLKQVKYIRLRQLYSLTVQHYRKERFEISQHRMDVMLRQLRTGTNFVYFQEDVVCYGKRTVDERYLEAVDVMLELTYCEPEFFSCERLEPPRLLRFTGQTRKLSFLHTVAWIIFFPAPASQKSDGCRPPDGRREYGDGEARCRNRSTGPISR